MGWIGQFFRKKENSANVPVVESNVALSFLKVREDMGKIGLWIRHFVEESVKNREEHLGLKREILEQKKIISEMQNNEEKILFALEKNASIVDAMGFQIEKISGKIEENNEKTAEKQHGTSHGTSA
ncbi:MAG: hypothetical protein NTV63_00130, partial [Candidatus Woesearchaeota archaeon]|nr:hypothetical protein [Candidatus Woesearchaeota archaeon]